MESRGRSFTGMRALRITLTGALFLTATVPGQGAMATREPLGAALSLYHGGRLDEAAEKFREALTLDSGLVQAHYHLAKISLIRSRPYDAFYALREALALDPGFARGERLLERLGPVLLERIESDLKAGRDLATASNVLGFLLIRRGRIREGIARERDALKIRPEFPEAHDDLAWAHYLERDFEKAYEMAGAAYRLDPVKPSIGLHYRHLFDLQRLGRSSGTVPFPGAQASPGPGAGDEDPGADRGGDAPGIPGSGREPLLLAGSDLIQDSMTGIHLLSQAAPGQSGPTTGSDATLKRGPRSPPPPPPPPRLLEPPPPLDAAILEELKKKYLDGLNLEKAGKYPEALARFREIIAIDPDYADSSMRVRDLTRLEENLDLYDKALAARKDKKWTWVLFTVEDIDLATLGPAKKIKSLDNLLGEAHHHLGRHEDAVKHLGRWIYDHPRDNELRYQLVKSLSVLKRYDLALEQYEKLRLYEPEALSRFPDLKKLTLRLWVKNYFDVIAGLGFVWVFSTGGYVTWRVRRGKGKRQVKRLFGRLAQETKFQKWREILQTVEELEQQRLTLAERVHVRCLQGTALLETGEPLKARKVADELHARHPAEPAVHHLRARVMLFNGETGPAAIAEYEMLLSLEPNNQTLLEALNSYYQVEFPDSEQAIRVLDRLMELDPTNPDYRYQRALRHLRAQDFSTDARQVYHRVLELSPHRADMQHAVAMSYFGAGQYLDAIKFAKRSVELELDNPTFHRLLIPCYQKLEMIDEGRQEYKRWIDKNPELPLLKEGLRALDRPVDSSEDMRPEQRETRELYEKGVLLYREGRFREAIAPLTSVMEVEHLRLSAGALLVRSYLKLQEIRSALALFERMNVDRKIPDEFLLSLCYDIAEVYVREEKLEKAHELYAFICRANVSYKDAFSKLERLEARRRPA